MRLGDVESPKSGFATRGENRSARVAGMRLKISVGERKRGADFAAVKGGVSGAPGVEAIEMPERNEGEGDG